MLLSAATHRAAAITFLIPPPLWGREGWGVGRECASVDAFA